jgi:integrase
MQSTKRPNGDGTIRKRTKINKDGSSRVYWEGRITIGHDATTGKQLQKTLTAKTQTELLQKMQTLRCELLTMPKSTPATPTMTFNQWADEWLETYLSHTKPSTAYLYTQHLETYVRPRLGKMLLKDITTTHIQKLYNALLKPTNPDDTPLSAKTVRDIHGVLHSCLERAVKLGYLSQNPSDACTLPRVTQREMEILDFDQLQDFLDRIKGHVHENLYKVAIYTGLREGELLGLPWSCVDFTRGILTVKQQLRREQKKGGTYYISSTKNGKIRTIKLAPSILEIFKNQKDLEDQKRLAAGDAWLNTGLVFTNEIGGYLSYRTVYDCFKRIVRSMGRPNLRFHDLRHTYATICAYNGDDPKTLQSNLGHATPAFSMTVYEHVTAQMATASADRMEAFIQAQQMSPSV